MSPPDENEASRLRQELPDAQLRRAIQRPAKPCHGRWEARILWTIYAPELNRYLGSAGAVGEAWPGVQQICRVQRLVRRKHKDGTTKHHNEVSYLITSLPPKRANASALLRRNRAHWGIESLHWLRDVTFGEDACPIYLGQGPQVFATLRNLAIPLLRWSGADTLAAAQRDLATRPTALIALFKNLANRLVK